jgi:tRNA threonylcarbamoyladenosine biosynthesis protein TsaB
MGLILGIETATEVCSVAIGKDGVCIAELNNLEGNSHASQLHPMVKKIFQETGFSLNQLDAIAVSKGPGSYTGLRVGVSAAKGFAYALKIPIVAVGTLPAMVSKLLVQTENIETQFAPMIDARRMEVYCGIFNNFMEEIDKVQAKIIDEDSFFEFLEKQKTVFFGNGASKCKSTIQHPNATFIDGFFCSASGLMPLAEKAFQSKSFENLAYFEPYYLKDFVGTTPKK